MATLVAILLSVSGVIAVVAACGAWAEREVPRTSGPAEPPLADWEAQGARRAAANLLDRLRDVDGRDAGEALRVTETTLRRLTAAQGMAVAEMILHPHPSSARRNDPGGG